MLKKDITFEDLETGEKRTETWYFNLNKAELVEMEVTAEGGYEEATKRIVESKDGKAIMAEFRRFILSSVGEKTEQGGFRKSDELRERFEQSPAYAELFMELVTSAEAGANFLSAIVPPSLGNRLSEVRNQRKIQEAQAQVEQDLGRSFGRSAREEAEYQRQQSAAKQQEILPQPADEEVVEATIEPAEPEPVHVEPIQERNVFDTHQTQPSVDEHFENTDNEFRASLRREARQQMGLDNG